MGVDLDYCKKTYLVPTNIDKKIAVDIGANIGGFSMAYHDTFEKIIFFEANPKTFEITSNNTKDYQNVTGYNLAVSKNSGEELVLMNHFSNDLGSVSCSPLVTNHKDWVENIGVVKTISLEDIFTLLNTDKINYLKLDCEVSEYEILLDKDLSNIDFMCMEIHCQVGFEKYNELLNHLSKFFILEGDYKFNPVLNKIVNCYNKNL